MKSVCSFDSDYILQSLTRMNRIQLAFRDDLLAGYETKEQEYETSETTRRLECSVPKNRKSTTIR